MTRGVGSGIGLGVLAWSPLGSGILTGKYKSLDDVSDDRRLSEGSHRLTEQNLEIARAVQKVAGEIGASPSQAAF